jgi:hypothetical protein
MGNRAGDKTKRLHKDIPTDELQEIYTVEGYVRKTPKNKKTTHLAFVPKDMKLRRWPELEGISDKTSLYRQTLRSISPSYWIIGCLSSTRARARMRGYEHNLNRDYLMDLMGYKRFDYWDPKKEVCPVLGIPYDFMSRGKGGRYNSKSIDRIDPSKGYIKGNIRFISRKANGMFLDGTPEEQLQAAVWKIKEAVHTITDMKKIKELLKEAERAIDSP